MEGGRWIDLYLLYIILFCEGRGEERQGGRAEWGNGPFAIFGVL